MVRSKPMSQVRGEVVGAAVERYLHRQYCVRMRQGMAWVMADRDRYARLLVRVLLRWPEFQPTAAKLLQQRGEVLPA